MNELNDEQIIEELLKTQLMIEEEIQIKNLVDSTMEELESEDFMPVFDEYFSGALFTSIESKFEESYEDETKGAGPCWDGYEQIGMKKGKGGKMVPNCVPIEKKSAKPTKDPDGGLTAAGRKFFNRTEGSNLKPGVKGPADTPEKMRRKGSFLTRFFSNPSGPMVDDKGRATRLALSASAWGERVPKNASDAAELAEKGRKLLKQYDGIKKKDDLESVEEKQLQGQTIGQMSGAPGSTAQGSLDAIDHDGDGMIHDGTPEETRAPYKRQSNSDYEKRRRKFVRAELARQGIKHNARVQDRSKAERDARARARAAFDKATVRAGAEAQAGIGRANTDAARDRRRQAESDRLTGQAARTSAADRKPADRYPNPEKKYPPGQKPSAPKPRDQKPADRYPNPSKPRDAEAERMERMRPKPRDVKPADRYPNPTRPDTKPADRYPEAPRGIRPEDGVNNRPKPSPKRTPGNNGTRKY